MSRTKETKFQPTDLVEAIQPCAITVDGQDYVFNPGKQRIRASHPAVQSNPAMFQKIDLGHGDQAA